MAPWRHFRYCTADPSALARSPLPLPPWRKRSACPCIALAQCKVPPARRPGRGCVEPESPPPWQGLSCITSDRGCLSSSPGRNLSDLHSTTRNHPNFFRRLCSHLRSIFLSFAPSALSINPFSLLGASPGLLWVGTRPYQAKHGFTMFNWLIFLST